MGTSCGIHHQPGGQQLAHHFFLAHPSDGQFVGMREMKRYALRSQLPYDSYFSGCGAALAQRVQVESECDVVTERKQQGERNRI